MANQFSVTDLVAQAMANAITAANDAGTQAIIRIYSGTMPADASAALAGNTVLAELTMSATSFGAATDANPGGRITAATITADSSADATGTATFFRTLTQAGGATTTQGTAGTSAADLIVNTVSFTAGSTVSISAFTITVPEGP